MKSWLDPISPEDEAAYQRNVAHVDAFLADLRQFIAAHDLQNLRGGASVSRDDTPVALTARTPQVQSAVGERALSHPTDTPC